MLSDYPSPTLLDNICRNVKNAIPPGLNSIYRIEGHEWGVLGSEFATHRAHHFDRILAADCLWMPSQHLNLARSMLHFLTLDPKGRVFIVAGIHTGCAKLAAFFDVAEEEGLEVETIYEENANGVRGTWVSEVVVDNDALTYRKRWLVIATLKRKA